MQERTYTVIAAFACGALALWVIFYLTQSPPDATSDKGETVLWSPQKQVNDQIPADENAASQSEITRPSPGGEVTYQPPENQNSGTIGKADL